MKHISLFSLALGGLLAQPVAALEILGGSVALSYNNVDDLGLKRTKFAGSIELGFGGKISTQIDVVAHRLESGSTNTGKSFGLHGIYRINPDFAVGIFAGTQTDVQPFGDANFYGIEGAYTFNDVKVQGYYGRSRLDFIPIDLDIYGLSVDYAISTQFSVGLKHDVTDIISAKLSDTALRGTYSMRNNVSLFAEAGQIDNGFTKNNYFGVGVSYGFGANKAATFNPRGSGATLGAF